MLEACAAGGARGASRRSSPRWLLERFGSGPKIAREPAVCPIPGQRLRRAGTEKSTSCRCARSRSLNTGRGSRDRVLIAPAGATRSRPLPRTLHGARPHARSRRAEALLGGRAARLLDAARPRRLAWRRGWFRPRGRSSRMATAITSLALMRAVHGPRTMPPRRHPDPAPCRSSRRAKLGQYGAIVKPPLSRQDELRRRAGQPRSGTAATCRRAFRPSPPSSRPDSRPRASTAAAITRAGSGRSAAWALRLQGASHVSGSAGVVQDETVLQGRRSHTHPRRPSPASPLAVSQLRLPTGDYRLLSPVRKGSIQRREDDPGAHSRTHRAREGQVHAPAVHRHPRARSRTSRFPTASSRRRSTATIMFDGSSIEASSASKNRTCICSPTSHDVSRVPVGQAHRRESGAHDLRHLHARGDAASSACPRMTLKKVIAMARGQGLHR